jgi:hypothetical protein
LVLGTKWSQQQTKHPPQTPQKGRQQKVGGTDWGTHATQGTQSPKKSRTTQNTQTSNRKKVGGTD